MNDNVDGEEVSVRETFGGSADGTKVPSTFDGRQDIIDGEEAGVKKTKLNIDNTNKPIRVIVNGDKGNPLFAVGYSFPKPSKEKKKSMKCHKRKGKAKIGRVLRPGNIRKRNVSISLPSVVEVRTDDEGTVSSMSTETGHTKHSFHRGLLRSKKLVKSLTDDNKKKPRLSMS